MDTIVAIDLFLGFWSQEIGEIEGHAVIRSLTTLN
jgi:hypothetical protein